MLYEKFLKCLDHLLWISDRINDGWKLKSYEDHVYIVKSVTQTLANKLDVRQPLKNLDDVYFDDQSAIAPSVTIRKWEYHILYSLSYGVPVLYFNVWTSSGELLPLDELWLAVNPNYKISNNKWFTLAQQEHPYLFRPFYYFHPCDTSEFMKNFESEEKNSVITWLSSIGQIIWLEMDHEYGKQCNFTDYEALKKIY